MILDELTLENVGTFRGKHTIKLTPLAGKPVVLIGGLNGAGKTTILESVHLALYGSLSQPSGRRSGSYDSYLRSLIHHGVPDTEGAAVQLTFRAYQQGAEHTYRIRRRWRSTGAAMREILLVAVDGKHDEALTSTWSEHVETFLPRGIAGLFFFDGERIEALADLDRSRQVLSSALASLLGLDLIDRLGTDLGVLRRRHRGAEIPDELRIAVEERKQVMAAARQSAEAAAAEAASARTSAEWTDKELHELTEKYRAAGGALLDQRDAAETRLQVLRSQLRDVDDQLRHEAADVAPMLQVMELLGSLSEQTELERTANRDKIVLSVVTERDQQVMAQLRAAKVRTSALEAIEQFLASDAAARHASSEVPRISGLREPEVIEPLRATVLPTVRRRLKGLILRRQSLLADLEQAERMLVTIPDADALAPLREAMERASTEAIRRHAALTQNEERLGMLKSERDKATTAYEAALDKSAQASLVADDDRRLVDHVDRVRATLETLRVAATERHLERISELILEALNRLFRKDNLVTAVQIDPVTHTVALSGAHARTLTANELSAGERQLLAVALLWGLARAAGQPLPMIVDTPLGRLDGSHRKHLIERYFPHASHQVILLSTDTEIDKDSYDQLRTKVGRAYRLEFDPTTNATAVETGYFWGQ
ncbi:MAG TPA: DNA sulfur modification protein DndD [Jatrophihabitans sp.]|nr:DNA sulfur modification protein DndD [Jatrophihabitans sp.]